MFDFLFKKKEPNKLWFNTDIHCHIIPGIDDGSRNPEMSAELIERMQVWGIERIIASPHVTQETFENTPQTIAPALALLNDELARRGNTIKVSNSAEYRIDEFFSEQLEAGNIMPYPANYILIENSFMQEPWNLDQLIFELQVKGYKPIMAHPERFSYYYGKRERYKTLHDAGALFQINVLSLCGYYGKKEKQVAEWLIDNDMVDFNGTDLHNHRHADAIENYLKSGESLKHARKLADRVLNNSLRNM
ncbi:MAG: hypothetical protein K2F74_08580 [Muribaculaceae bacterium]|nr:hypothetical protein [Muribaculaceae bacterium]MDE6131632.1 hypothetical protein [Muribaculaceae bacterium]